MIFALRYSWWLLGVLAVALVLQVFSAIGILSPIRNLALTATQPVESALSAIFQPIADFLDYDKSGLRDENQRLREENADLQARLTQSLIEGERLQELESVLDLVESDDRTFEPADRVAIVSESAGESVIVINKGSADGIRQGMVVLSPQQTLVGSVSSVATDYAYVRLLNDSRTRVNVRIQQTDVSGTLKGDIRGRLSIEFVQGDARPGYDVVTSGLGGSYPPDILVGEISSVSGTPQDLALTVNVDPEVRLSTITTVLVLTSFTPSIIGPEGS